jgi:hypothetical protein
MRALNCEADGTGTGVRVISFDAIRPLADPTALGVEIAAARCEFGRSSVNFALVDFA